MSQICGADQNDDNLRISRAYLRISDHRRIMVRVRVADCCIQTAEESDKMRINHVTETDQCRAAPQICSAPHFVVSLFQRLKLFSTVVVNFTSQAAR